VSSSAILAAGKKHVVGPREEENQNQGKGTHSVSIGFHIPKDFDKKKRGRHKEGSKRTV